jgi:hypothetical protein
MITFNDLNDEEQINNVLNINKYNYITKSYNFDNIVKPKILNGSCIKYFNNDRLIFLTHTIAIKLTGKSIIPYSGLDISVLKIFIEQKIKIPSQCLYNLMNPFHFDNPEIYEVLNLLLLSGHKFDDKCMEHACIYFCKDAIKYLLEKNINPTKNDVDKILGHNPQKSTIKLTKHNNKTKSEIINILINNKYDFSNDHIFKILSMEKLDFEIKKLNIKIDETFINNCKKINMYPDLGTKTEYIYDILCLEEACKHRTFSNIKKLVTKDKIKPNMKCLENACKVSNNYYIIEYLIYEGNLIPTYDCIINYMKVNEDKASILMLDLFLNKK